MKPLIAIIFLIITHLCNSQTVNKEKPIEEFPEIEAEYTGEIRELQKQLLNLLDYPETTEEPESCSRFHFIFTLETNGRVSKITLAKNQCSTHLTPKGLEAIKENCRFKPAYNDNKPVRSRISIPVTICFTN